MGVKTDVVNKFIFIYRRTYFQTALSSRTDRWLDWWLKIAEPGERETKQKNCNRIVCSARFQTSSFPHSNSSSPIEFSISFLCFSPVRVSVDRWSEQLIGVSRLLCQIGFFISTFSVAAADVVVAVSSICVVSENSPSNKKKFHMRRLFSKPPKMNFLGIGDLRSLISCLLK